MRVFTDTFLTFLFYVLLLILFIFVSTGPYKTWQRDSMLPGSCLLYVHFETQGLSSKSSSQECLAFIIQMCQKLLFSDLQL